MNEISRPTMIVGMFSGRPCNSMRSGEDYIELISTINGYITDEELYDVNKLYIHIVVCQVNISEVN